MAKLHENMGHLSNDRMIVMLKAAGAKEDVMEFVKKRFSCELCSKRQKEVRRRVAAYPRTYTFNRIVAVDTFFLPWRGSSIPILNVVDHGSHYQVTVPIKELDGTDHRGGTPGAEEAWRAFLEAWVRRFGAAEIVISDAGPEYGGAFTRGLELHSVMQHVTDAESPWQRDARGRDQEKGASRAQRGPDRRSSPTAATSRCCWCTSRPARTNGTRVLGTHWRAGVRAK